MSERAGSDAEGASTDGEPAGLRSLRIHAELAERLTVVSNATANLSLAIGDMGEANGTELVLVSSIELSLRCEDQAIDPEGSEFGVPLSFQRLVSWENTAFVIARLAEDYADASAQVRAVATGQVRPDPERLAIVVAFMQQAQGHISRCLEHLDATSTLAV